MFDAIGLAHGERGAPTEGVPIAAQFLDISVQHLYRQIDPEQAGGISFGRVAQLTRQFGCPQAAEFLALAAGGVFLPTPTGDGEMPELVADVLVQTGEAITAIGHALNIDSPGGERLTKAEAAKALPSISEALASLATLYVEVSEAAGVK
jgi:hypothetical protein